MKKILLTAIAMTVGAGLYAQGTIKFANSAASLVTSNGPAGSTSFNVSLYWGAAGSTEAQLVEIGASGPGQFSVGALNPALPGRFSTGTTLTTGPGTAPGGNGVFEVRGWTGSAGTYEAAYAAAVAGSGGLVGSSGIWTQATGGGGTPPAVPSPLVFGAGGFNGLNLVPVPEPTTLALGGLGAAALLLFRRRK